MRNAVKKLRGTSDRQAAEEFYPQVCSMLDRLAKKNVIHKNKAGNLKSKLAKHVHSLA
jgi:small subunit ribosomal protein S20